MLSRILTESVQRYGGGDELRRPHRRRRLRRADRRRTTPRSWASRSSSGSTTSSRELYDQEDRERGHVEVLSRRHTVERFPLMSLTIALVSTDRVPVTHLAELIDIAQELKAHGKGIRGSVLVGERRRRDDRQSPTAASPEENVREPRRPRNAVAGTARRSRRASRRGGARAAHDERPRRVVGHRERERDARAGRRRRAAAAHGPPQRRAVPLRGVGRRDPVPRRDRRAGRVGDAQRPRRSSTTAPAARTRPARRCSGSSRPRRSATLPLVAGNALYGFLLARRSRRPARCTGAERRFLQTLADALALALERADLVRALDEERTRVVAAERRLATAQEAASALMAIVAHELRCAALVHQGLRRDARQQPRQPARPARAVPPRHRRGVRPARLARDGRARPLAARERRMHAAPLRGLAGRVRARDVHGARRNGRAPQGHDRARAGRRRPRRDRPGLRPPRRRQPDRERRRVLPRGLHGARALRRARRRVDLLGDRRRPAAARRGPRRGVRGLLPRAPPAADGPALARGHAHRPRHRAQHRAAPRRPHVGRAAVRGRHALQHRAARAPGRLGACAPHRPPDRRAART